MRQMIVWGRIALGTRLVEAEIADRLGVSRTPTRSAIHRLLQEGYVTALDRAKERRLIVAVKPCRTSGAAPYGSRTS